MLATRKPGLRTERIDSELIVFHPETNEVHALNESAALVYEMCDGATPPEEMRNRLPEVGLPADGEIVALALAELVEAALIEVQPEISASGVTRRTLTRRLGLSALGITLIPVVDTILAQPAAAQASGMMGSTTPPLGTTPLPF